MAADNALQSACHEEHVIGRDTAQSSCKKPFVVAASCCRIASQFPNVLVQCANLQPHCESKMLRISDDGEV
jgi:hypothetical protein